MNFSRCDFVQLHYLTIKLNSKHANSIRFDFAFNKFLMLFCSTLFCSRHWIISKCVRVCASGISFYHGSRYTKDKAILDYEIKNAIKIYYLKIHEKLIQCQSRVYVVFPFIYVSFSFPFLFLNIVVFVKYVGFLCFYFANHCLVLIQQSRYRRYDDAKLPSTLSHFF